MNENKVDMVFRKGLVFYNLFWLHVLALRTFAIVKILISIFFSGMDYILESSLI